MDKNKIISFLEESELGDIENIDYKQNIIVIRFFYDFDDDEIKSARAYANDECDEEENSETWQEEYFKTYLNDMAVDNVGEILEECMEKLDVKSEFISYSVNDEEFYSEFIAVFYDNDTNVDVEKVLEELNL